MVRKNTLNQPNCNTAGGFRRRVVLGRRHRMAMLALGAVLTCPALATASLEPISVSNIVGGINVNNLLNPSDVGFGSVTLNTGSGNSAPTLVAGGTTYSGQIVTQADGSRVAVFGFAGNVTVSNGVTVTGSLPLVIYSTGNMAVSNLSVVGGVGGTAPIVLGQQPGAGGVGGPGGAAGGRGGSAASYIGLAAAGQGPGGGTGGPAEGSGGGGGFGGAGGTGFVFPNAGPATTPVPGGKAYGDLASNLTGGSGAGGGSGKVGFAGGGGGGGGGAVALIAGGTLAVNGTINATGGYGGDGYYGGGGGSGGGVLLATLGNAGTITGTGSVVANGGNSGSFPGYAGGGGGGGRVLVYFHQWNVGPGGTALSTIPGTYAGNPTNSVGSYTGANGAVEIVADSTYISSGNFLKIAGSGAATTLDDGGAGGYSSPLTFITGGFTVNGSLTLNNATQTIGSLAGTGSLTLTGSNLILNPAAGVSSTFTGSISGNGSITLSGPGDFALGGNNTYSGGTFINGGVLSILSSTALGSGALTFGGGTLNIPANATIPNTVSLQSGGANGIEVTGAGVTASISGVIGGNGALTFTGSTPSSTLNLTAANSYSGGTTVNSGILEVSNAGTVGTGVLDIASGAQFVLNNINSTAGGLAGAGTVSLGNNNLALTPATNTVDFFNGQINGVGGSLTVGGAGSVVLGGVNTYDGGTLINNGATLLFAAQSAIAAGNIANNGNLGLYGAFTTATITGNFSQGATGTLVTRVAGSAAGQFDAITVAGSAQVAGNLAVVFQNHYAPLSSPTTLTILQSATPNAVSGNFSSINLGNHPINVFASTVDTGTDLNLVFTLHQPSLIPYALTPNQIAMATYFDATDGYNGGSHPSPEYQALINSIDSAYASQIPGILDQLSPIDLQAFPQVAIQNGINLDQTFSQYAQTIDGGARGLNTSGLTLLQPGEDNPNQAALGRMLQSESDVVSLDNNLPAELPGYLSDLQTQTQNLSHPAPTTNWGAFVTGAAQFDDYSNTGSISSPNITTADVTAGIDYHIAQPLAVGVLFNYAHSFLTLDPYNSKGSVNSYTPGVYANLTENGWFIDGLAAYTYSSNSETRNITAGTFSGAANGNFNGNAINGSIDMGKQLYSSGTNFSGTGGWTLIPMVSLGYTHADFNSFSETGAGAANLNVQSFSTDSFRTVLSATFLYRIVASPNMAWTPGLTLGWRHEYLNDPQGITSQLQGAGTGGFTINTESPSRDVAIIAPSLSVTVNRNISAFVDYELDLGSSNFHAQQVFAGVAVAF